MKKNKVTVLVIMLLMVLGALPGHAQERINGFLLGPQMWSFHNFTFVEAVEKAKATGAKVVEVYPGQTFSKLDEREFNHNADPDLWANAKIELEKAGLQMVNYGVVHWEDKDELARIFDFAKVMGLPAITVEPRDPSDTTWDMLEAMIKEYDIKVGIHNHPVREDNPEYIYWNPERVLAIVEGRDPRLGLACDTGHWLRSGIDPLKAIKKAEGRIISIHLKDLTEMDRDAHDVPYGQGVANVAEILKELQRQGFDGNISIEYEYNWDNNVPEIRQCIEFVKNFK